MITVNGKTFEVVDAHVHVWDKYHGTRFGDTSIEKVGNGIIRYGETERQFLPPEFEDYSVKINVLEGYMRIANVDRACILQNPCYGDQRNYVASIIKENPGKFVSLGMVDPRNKSTIIQEIDTLMDDYHNIGIKIEVPDVPFKMDDPEYDVMWKHVQDKGGIVAIDLGNGTGEYDFNIERLTNLVKRYPKMKLMLPHLGVSRLWDKNEKYPYPNLTSTLSLLDINKDNLYLDLANVPQITKWADEYPFYRGQDIIRYVKSFCGMDRIMWGSDIPSVLIHSTYTQVLDVITKHCSFLTADDLEKVLSKNALKFLFKKE